MELEVDAERSRFENVPSEVAVVGVPDEDGPDSCGLNRFFRTFSVMRGR